MSDPAELNDTPEPTEPSDAERSETLRVATRLVYENNLRLLKAEISGQDRLVQRLALAATHHIVEPASAVRLTLVGPSGTGKTTMARAVARLTNRPFVELSVTDLAQTGWQGPQLSELLSESLSNQVRLLHLEGKGTRADLSKEPVLFLDEFDKCAYGGHVDTARGHYLGKQQTMLGLLGSNGHVLIGSESVSTARMMIICAGVFDGLRETPYPMPADVEALGFMHELVERMGPIFLLEPLRGTPLEKVLRKGIEAKLTTAKAFGYELEISPEAICYTARAIARERAGPRSGVSWLAAAADECLGRLLDSDAPAGSRAILSPDDLRFGRIRNRALPPLPDWPDEPPSLAF